MKMTALKKLLGEPSKEAIERWKILNALPPDESIRRLEEQGLFRMEPERISHKRADNP